MRQEIEIDSKPETPDPVLAVSGFLDDANAMKLLQAWRKGNSWANLKNGNSQKFSGLIEHFTEIHQAFGPRSKRILWTHIRRFPTLTRDDIEDILQEQEVRLWRVIGIFRWEDYFSPEERMGAAPSFTAYLDLSTGSFFAQEIYDRRSDSPLDKARLVKRSGQIPRPTEQAVLWLERSRELSEALENWSLWAPRTVSLVIRHCEEGISVTDLSREEELSRSAIKGRIAEGKRRLAARLGKEMEESYMTRDVRYRASSRKELLEQRREILEKRFPLWRDFLPPKVSVALGVFYGLNGEGPVYDYQKAAQKTGMTVTSLRVYVPQGMRIILGKKLPSEWVARGKEEEELYQSWARNPGKFCLDERQTQVLKLRFEEGMPLKKIGNSLSFSQETARRMLNRALNIIRDFCDY